MRRLSSTVLRIPVICALVAWLAGGLAQAQKPVEHNYVMEVAGMVGRAQEKIVLSAIKDQDPGALVSVDLPSQHVKIRTWMELDRATLEAGLAPFSISVISLDPLFPLQHTERSMAGAGLPGFPQYVDTGDPETDEANYQTQKAAWITAHPDLYPPAQNDVAPAPR